jgi:hypothetical protein
MGHDEMGGGPIEQLLPNSLASAAHQAILRHSVRRYGLTISGINAGVRDRRFIAAKLSLNNLAEILQQMKESMTKCGAIMPLRPE